MDVSMDGGILKNIVVLVGVGVESSFLHPPHRTLLTHTS
jgi:hypothetical protein